MPTSRAMILSALLMATSPATILGLAPAEQPGTIVLADLEDLYGPVPFDHQGHADMARLSTGCVTCHHHTPQGQEHPACRNCHPQGAHRENVAMPGLKGAYHRQCLSCHREWSHDRACGACHVPKPVPGAILGSGALSPVRNEFARMKPPVELPDTYVYETGHAPRPVVTFHHANHAEAFGVQCAQCHSGDTCGRCHDRARSVSPVETKTASPHLKSACFNCHTESNCAFCHDQAQRPRFDHATTAGWSLRPHHTQVPCSECHGPASAFKVPAATCHACHAQRNGRSSGQLVSDVSPEAASEVDCLSCHVDMRTRFDHAASIHSPASKPRGCDGCHRMGDAVSPRPARDRQCELCLSCHDRPIESDQGRPLANIAALVSDSPNLHGPVRDGDCTACHDPHSSDHARLLVGEYAPEFYAPFSMERYELCFRCHDRKQVQSESGEGLTGFRDGDRNLHWLHVRQGKGRTCRVCHEVHASSRPFHIRESVPFADSTWMLPINYQQADHGGSCAPGCHSPKSYERNRSDE